MATRADESSICACISEPYVVNLAGELFQSGVISDAGYQAAIADNSMLSPAHKVAHLVFEVVNKVGESPNNYKFIFRPGAQTLGRPGKPYANKVTHNSLVLSWGKPQHGADSVQSYTITYRAMDDPPGRWHMQTASEQDYAELTNLAAKTSYLFKVRAESTTGMSGPNSETSVPIETKCLVHLADEMIPHCQPSQLSSAGLKVYLLPTNVTMKKSNILKVTVGQSQHVTAATHKVLMLVGATGAGKTTLINAMANYIMGVDWEDEYRFKLISEETAHDQTKSHTSCITAYTFEYSGSPLPYTLTDKCIDTPGYILDQLLQGLARDRQIVVQIKEFFTIRGDEGIDQYTWDWVCHSGSPGTTDTNTAICV